METLEALQAVAQRLRVRSIELTSKAGSGHPTTCMSMAELAAALFFHEMRYDVSDPENPANDEFVLSKGHAAPILWAAYREAGVIPEEDLASFRAYGSVYEGHPTPRMPWVRAATGSLGQGLAVGVGLALAHRLLGAPGRTYVVLGDGECAEGSVWEAAELAAKEHLSSMVAIVDANRLGQSGESLHGHDVEQWAKKFSAFGWETAVIDGHELPEILHAFERARQSEKPFAVVAKTFKGRGVSFLEDKEGWHGKPLQGEDREKALAELGPLAAVDARSLVRAPEPFAPKDRKAGGDARIEYPPDAAVATRQAFGTMLAKLGADERVVALDGDTKNSTYSETFKKAYPERFVECYIAEQNLVGVASGLAAKGFVPVSSTFGTFFTRAHDQIRMAAISGHNLKLVGSHVGVSIGEDGPSQMGLEDLALFRCLPGSVVLYPSDGVSAEACTRLLVEHEGISYLRTSRPKQPILYKDDEEFSVGGSKVLRKGGDVLIVTAGVTVHEALKAAGELKEVTIIDAYSVKPLDAKAIAAHAEGKKVVVVEEHYPEGGLGEAVAAAGIRVDAHLCVRGVPMSGSPGALLEAFKLDAKAIVEAVKGL